MSSFSRVWITVRYGAIFVVLTFPRDDRSLALPRLHLLFRASVNVSLFVSPQATADCVRNFRSKSFRDNKMETPIHFPRKPQKTSKFSDSSPGLGVSGKTGITFWFLSQLDEQTHHSIALKLLYLTSFESNQIKRVFEGKKWQ